MNEVAESSALTSMARGRKESGRTRARLQLEFSLQHRPPEAAADLAHGVLLFKSVSAAIASEAASGALAQGAWQEAGSDFEMRIAEAVDDDFKTLIVETKQFSSTDPRQLAQLVKAWSEKTAKQVLTTYLLDATLDPLTWRIAQRDVGPRPKVSVLLYLPGSYTRSTTSEPPTDVDIALVYRGGSRADEGLDRLANAMTPDVVLPSPPVVLQARRNAEARTALLTEFGALTASQVAELSGSEAKNRSALAGRWRREGRLVAVDHHGTTYYPAFQFDSNGKPRPVVGQVLSLLDRPSITPWQQALWFTTANGWLEGRRPVDLLEKESAAVVAAAREASREPVG